MEIFFTWIEPNKKTQELNLDFLQVALLSIGDFIIILSRRAKHFELNSFIKKKLFARWLYTRQARWVKSSSQLVLLGCSLKRSTMGVFAVHCRILS